MKKFLLIGVVVFWGLGARAQSVTISASPSGAVCAGTQVTYTATTSGFGGDNVKYTWSINGGNDSTTHSTAASTSNFYAVPSNGDVITVSVTDQINSNTATTSPVHVIVNQPSTAPTSITGPGNATSLTLCSPANTTLTANGGTLGTGASYVWGTGSTVGSNVISGQSAATLSLTNLTSSNTYWVSVTGTTAPCSNPTGNATFSVNVNQPSTAPTSITGPGNAASLTLCSPANTTLTANGGTLGTGASYVWGTGSTVGSNVISGQSAATLSLTNLTSSNTYWVSVTGTSAPCSNPTGNATFAVTVNQPSTAPTSITGPGNATSLTLCSPANTTLTANGGTLGTGASYVWGTGSTVGSNVISGQSSATLSLNSLTSSNTYWVSVTGTAAPCSNPGGSATFSLTVQPAPIANAGNTTSATTCYQATSYTIPSMTTPYSYANGSVSWSASSSSGTTGSITNGGTVTPTYNFSSTDIANGAVVTLTMSVAAISPCSTPATTTFTLTITGRPVAHQGATITATKCANVGSYSIPLGYSSSNGTVLWTANSSSGTAGHVSDSASLTPTYNFSNADIRNTTATTVTLTMTVTSYSPCSTDSTATFILTINPNPRSSFTINNPNQCLTGNDFIFTVDDSLSIISSYSWTFGSLIPGISSASAPNIHFGNSQSNQSVELTVTAGNTCTYSPPSKAINVYPMPDSAFTLPKYQLCTDTAVVFNQTSTANTNTSTIIWGDLTGNTVNSSVTGTNTASHYYASQAGAYTLTFIPVSSHGCTDSSTASVLIYPKPTAGFTEDTVTAHCRSTNFFTFTDASTVSSWGALQTWKYYFGDGTADSSGHDSFHSYSPGSNIISSYTVTEYVYTNHGCSDTVQKGLIVYPNPVEVITDNTASAGGRQDTLCAGTAYSLTASANNGSGSYNYQWFDAQDDVASTADTLFAIAQSSSSPVTKTYKVVVTDFERCTDTVFSHTIFYYPNPDTSIISGPSSLCSGSQNIQYLVTNPQDSVRYEWYSAPTLGVNGDKNYVANLSFPGPPTTSAVISVNATNSPYGCSVESHYTVTLDTSTLAPYGAVVYDNGTLICTNSAVDSFRWGYDTAGAPQYSIPLSQDNTATQQALILSSSSPALPDTSSVFYWVEIYSGGCLSKIYYNSPLETTTSVQDINGERVKITAYPNPVGDYFNLIVASNQTELWTIEVYDASGRKIMSQKAMLDKNTSMQVPASLWSGGAYTLHVRSADGTGAVLVLVKD